jgi:hypothetical protein
VADALDQVGALFGDHHCGTPTLSGAIIAS